MQNRDGGRLAVRNNINITKKHILLYDTFSERKKMLRTRVHKANVRPELELQYNFDDCRHDKWQTHFFSPHGEGLFASSLLPSFVFSAAQKKISYSNHMKTFLSNFFRTAFTCILSCTHFVDKATGAVFLFFFRCRKLGVCVQFSTVPLPKEKFV